MIQKNRISERQLRRMVFIEAFGTGALSVPALACYKGQSGFSTLLFYGLFLTVITVIFVICLEKIQGRTLGKSIQIRDNVRKNDWKDKNIEKHTEENIMYVEYCPLVVKMVYIIRFFINAVALFYFFGKTVQTVYMPDGGFFFILLPAAVFLWYSMYTNLQKRARFLELIFPWIITAILIAIILSFFGIERTMVSGEESAVWPGIFSDNILQSMGNGYLLLLCSSPVEFLLFTGFMTESESVLRENSAGKNKRIKMNLLMKVLAAVAGVFLCNAVLLFLTVRTIGRTLAGQSAWPVIKMMQLIRMPGGFLERFDILPIVFWILCMMAVLSGYLYYGKYLLAHVFYNRIKGNPESGIEKVSTAKSETVELRTMESGPGKTEDSSEKSSLRYSIVTGTGIVVLLLLACLVENYSVLWTFYLKYKIFVDFPLSVLLPLLVCFYGEKDLEHGRSRETEKEKNLGGKKAGHYLLVSMVILSVLFSLNGCQRLTDVEEKNYILSMYVDYPSAEENVYEFWVAHADLSKMEERDDEIPCQITKIRAENLQKLEEEYRKLVPGKTEWNHIYTIFLGTGMATDKKACTRLLKEWDAAWQKSPNVLLALCPESPKKLYTVKNIPEGAAGQEVNLLAEQNKETLAENICETPIDYLRAVERKKEKIALYRITIEDEIKMGKGVV